MVVRWTATRLEPQATRSNVFLTTLSFIVPVLNEGPLIAGQLQRLQAFREAGHEVIVVDGGSSDGTAELAQPLADQVLATTPGRSAQMNQGAAAASGEVFVFVHSDTQLPDQADDLVQQALAQPDASAWGWFAVRLSNPAWPYRIIAACMNLRTRLTFVCTGDQALFVTRALFDKVGGFPPLALMEDVAISKLLRRKSTPTWINTPVIASSRRWEQRGIVQTTLLMWWLRLLYFCGVSPARLQRLYYPGSSE